MVVAEVSQVVGSQRVDDDDEDVRRYGEALIRGSRFCPALSAA